MTVDKNKIKRQVRMMAQNGGDLGEFLPEKDEQLLEFIAALSLAINKTVKELQGVARVNRIGLGIVIVVVSALFLLVSQLHELRLISGVGSVAGAAGGVVGLFTTLREFVGKGR